MSRTSSAHEKRSKKRQGCSEDLFQQLSEGKVRCHHRCFGTWPPETCVQHRTSLEHLRHIRADSPEHLLVMEVAESLYVDAAHTLQVMECPDFPEDFRLLALKMGMVLNVFPNCTAVK